MTTLTKTRAKDLSKELLAMCKAVKAKRARTVIDHILKHGVITNEDLSETYGYDHPPRAIRDVRDNGIPLITHKIRSTKTGRMIGAYTFGALTDIKRGRIGGRKAFPKRFKQQLLERYGGRDAFTREPLAERYLQIDHRIPYEIAGDHAALDPAEFMLIDASSQRSKSWSCEHCVNTRTLRSIAACKSCYWASPEAYTHVAMEQKRRLDLVWSGDEVREFESLARDAKKADVDLGEFAKKRLCK